MNTFINSTTTDEIIPENLSPAVNATTRLKTDFLAVGTAAVNRGFRSTPVDPETKAGVMWKWNYEMRQATSVYDVTQLAKLYPNHHVGIVGKRGIGNMMFLDIDGEGVVEEIERETGQKMPLTYIVQSRPQSAPCKRHFYFRQTAYSFTKFGGATSKQINVKNRYDVKGVGGSGYVVAAGCIRDTG